MKILRGIIGCEKSQQITARYRAAGHEVYSCDTQDADINSDWHIKGNVLDYLYEGWDFGIFHPPCTYLTVANTYMERGCRFFYEIYPFALCLRYRKPGRNYE